MANNIENEQTIANAIASSNTPVKTGTTNPFRDAIASFLGGASAGMASNKDFVGSGGLLGALAMGIPAASAGYGAEQDRIREAQMNTTLDVFAPSVAKTLESLGIEGARRMTVGQIQKFMPLINVAMERQKQLPLDEQNATRLASIVKIFSQQTGVPMDPDEFETLKSSLIGASRDEAENIVKMFSSIRAQRSIPSEEMITPEQSVQLVGDNSLVGQPRWVGEKVSVSKRQEMAQGFQKKRIQEQRDFAKEVMEAKTEKNRAKIYADAYRNFLESAYGNKIKANDLFESVFGIQYSPLLIEPLTQKQSQNSSQQSMDKGERIKFSTRKTK